MVISNTHIADNNYRYIGTINGVAIGGFEAIIDTSNHKNVCIVDCNFENYSLKKDALSAFAKKMYPLPVYILAPAFKEWIEHLFGLSKVTPEEIGKTPWQNYTSETKIMAVYRIIPSKPEIIQIEL